MFDLICNLGQELEEENDEELFTSQTQLRESNLASFQAALFQEDEIKCFQASEQIGNPDRSEQLSLQLDCLERLTQAHYEEIQRIRASKHRADTLVAKARQAQDPASEYAQFLLLKEQDVLSPYTSSSTETTSQSAHCTSVRRTICPHRHNVASTTATAPTSSQNVEVITTAPI